MEEGGGGGGDGVLENETDRLKCATIFGVIIAGLNYLRWFFSDGNVKWNEGYI